MKKADFIMAATFVAGIVLVCAILCSTGCGTATASYDTPRQSVSQEDVNGLIVLGSIFVISIWTHAISTYE